MEEIKNEPTKYIFFRYVDSSTTADQHRMERMISAIKPDKTHTQILAYPTDLSFQLVPRPIVFKVGDVEVKRDPFFEVADPETGNVLYLQQLVEAVNSEQLDPKTAQRIALNVANHTRLHVDAYWTDQRFGGFADVVLALTILDLINFGEVTKEKLKKQVLQIYSANVLGHLKSFNHVILEEFQTYLREHKIGRMLEMAMFEDDAQQSIQEIIAQMRRLEALKTTSVDKDLIKFQSERQKLEADSLSEEVLQRNIVCGLVTYQFIAEQLQEITKLELNWNFDSLFADLQEHRNIDPQRLEDLQNRARTHMQPLFEQLLNIFEGNATEINYNQITKQNFAFFRLFEPRFYTNPEYSNVELIQAYFNKSRCITLA